jgi:hypothetical protein
MFFLRIFDHFVNKLLMIVGSTRFHPGGHAGVQASEAISAYFLIFFMTDLNIKGKRPSYPGWSKILERNNA